MSLRVLCLGGALALAWANPVCAQFQQLSATDDGSQLYFVSQLTLYNEAAATTESRLFRVGPDGVSLFAERGALANPSGGSSGDGVMQPQVTGDGSLVGFTFGDVCVGTAACGNEAEIRGQKTLDLGPGSLQLSRDGRWALVSQPVDFLLGGNGTAVLLDLSSNQRTTVPPTPFGLNHVLASDGTVLAQSPGGPLSLWKQGQITPIQFPAGPNQAPQAISDDASTLVTIGVASPLQLNAFNLATGRLTQLYAAQSPAQLPLFLGMSNNGRYVLYNAGGQAYVADTSTGQSQALALPAGEMTSDGTISGLGDYAFLATTLGRIVKVAQTDGSITPIIPATPSVGNLSQLSPGSLVRLTGSVAGTADYWDGRILVNGKALPVLAAKIGEVDVQVPWEQPTGQYPFVLAVPQDSPFQQSLNVTVAPFAPMFEPLDAGETAILPIKIVKSDFSGLQTTQPAPGDAVIIYMTGLGPVSGPVQTGVPASLTTVNPIVNTLTCTFEPQKQSATTLFAGLAPGMIGIYQVVFQMPPVAAGGPLNGMGCTLGGTSGGAGFGFIAVGIGNP